MQNGKLYSFYPQNFKTGRAIKTACDPGAKKLDNPPRAMVDVLRIMAAIDRPAALSMACRIVDSDVVPRDMWTGCAEVLCDGKDPPEAPRFVRAFALPDSFANGLRYGRHKLEKWAAFLGGPSTVTTDLLIDRFQHALRRAIPKLPDDTFDKTANGAAEVATFLAAALLMQRSAWQIVPDLANATFTHPNKQLRATLGELLLFVDMPVTVSAPRLDSFERTQYPFLRNELARRLRTDAGAAYEELSQWRRAHQAG